MGNTGRRETDLARDGSGQGAEAFQKTVNRQILLGTSARQKARLQHSGTLTQMVRRG